MRQLTKFAAKRVVSSKLPANSDVRSVRDSLQVFCYIVWNFEEMHSMQAYLYHWVGGFLLKTLKMRLYAQVYYASVPVPQVEGSCNCYLPLEKAWLSSISYFLLNYAPFEIVFSILRCAMENILFQTLLFNKKYSSPKQHCRVPLWTRVHVHILS